MEHTGSCHCGNLHVRIHLTRAPQDTPIRSCACSFCQAHGTRTVSDPDGDAMITADDWTLVQRYRFGTRTADYLLCRRCGVYVGAVCDSPAGQRAVINTRCLQDSAAFTRKALRPDYDQEAAPARIARRSATWMPVTVSWPP